MTDAPKPVFKAPLPPQMPKAPQSPRPVQPTAAPVYQPKPVSMPAAEPVNEPTDGIYDDNFAAQFNLPPSVLTTKVMGMIMGAVLLFGLIVGASLFGGSSKVTTQGLGGVVVNPEVPGNRPRCGIAEKTQGCVLYLMNASRRDREARSFYDEASRVTGVPSYTIELGNIEYATSIIRPGYLAQINIPPTTR